MINKEYGENIQCNVYMYNDIDYNFESEMYMASNIKSKSILKLNFTVMCTTATVVSLLENPDGDDDH